MAKVLLFITSISFVNSLRHLLILQFFILTNIVLIQNILPLPGTLNALAANHNSEIGINLDKGLLSVNAENALLSETLLRIGQQAKIKIVLYGNSDSRITQNLSNVPLLDGIQRLARDDSIAVMYNIIDGAEGVKKLETIQEIWVFNSSREPTVTGVLHTNIQNELETEDSKQTDTSLLSKSNNLEILRSQDQYREDDEISHWLNTMSTSTDHLLREQAIDKLQNIGSDSAIAAMATVLGDDDVQIRHYVTESLSSIDNDRAVQLLGQILIGDKDPFVRLEAVRFFEQRNDEISHAFLNTATTDQNEEIRAIAQQALTAY